MGGGDSGINAGTSAATGGVNDAGSIASLVVTQPEAVAAMLARSGYKPPTPIGDRISNVGKAFLGFKPPEPKEMIPQPPVAYPGRAPDASANVGNAQLIALLQQLNKTPPYVPGIGRALLGR